jgi:catechol 1,2-dioxygenase
MYILKQISFIIKPSCMQRRTFIKTTTLSAVAISASGFIRFDGNRYVGDCETTTDILGPFYRPGSPMRNNLIIKGEPGDPIELSGTIKHNDCKTPYKRAKIELWHCSAKGEYDNTSNEYRYRGTTLSDDKGHYSFLTVLPVPYDAGGSMRPAHFHLMITAEGYQPFVTQLYFTGDDHITKDASASDPNAKRRILDVQTLNDGTKKVSYDVSMSPKLAAETAVIDRLTGVYTDEKDKNNKMEIFKKDNLLWMKNEVFGEDYEYIGNNTFQYPNAPQGMSLTLLFEIIAQSAVKVTKTYVDEKGEKHINVAMKIMKE